MIGISSFKIVLGEVKMDTTGPYDSMTPPLPRITDSFKWSILRARARACVCFIQRFFMVVRNAFYEFRSSFSLAQCLNSCRIPQRPIPFTCYSSSCVYVSIVNFLLWLYRQNKSTLFIFLFLINVKLLEVQVPPSSIFWLILIALINDKRAEFDK
jgi:hypothetical protein